MANFSNKFKFNVKINLSFSVSAYPCPGMCKGRRANETIDGKTGTSYRIDAYSFWNFNPLTARIFTVLRHTFISGQSVTHRSMGREAPRYPPTSVSRSIKRSNFQDEITCHWQLKG